MRHPWESHGLPRSILCLAALVWRKPPPFFPRLQRCNSRVSLLSVFAPHTARHGNTRFPRYPFDPMETTDAINPASVSGWRAANALAVEVEKRNFAQTQRMTALEVARLASETRKAYFGAIAAEESVRYLRKVKQAAEAGAGLARKMAEVGNFNRLQQAREQGFYASAALDLARAEQASIAARERLTKLLGLPSPQAIRLPERLPDLPKLPDELPAVEQTALDQRLDLQAVRLETEALAKNLGLTQATRFINVLEFGPARVLEGARDSGYKRGYEVSFELPIFDFGGSKVAKAEAIYGQAVERAAEAAINARSEVREAYSAYRNSFDIAKHYRDEIVPLNKRIAEENLLRYNGMLIGVFELLADARSQITSVNSYIESLRDYWIAQSDLQMALIGKPSLAAASRTAPASTGRPDH
ncbi:TolC family protein [Zoogloea oleivorans]|uniref:TolC family protein n=2 Tax=Zoogloea oleivorans TaxID=1552750 RepID=A0A6C2CQ05_9RHOO|nr:TolC family protein [Zoogloea oleivorans]